MSDVAAAEIDVTRKVLAAAACRGSLYLSDAEVADLAAALARVVPADEPRHEIDCPSCGATIRARMADHPTTTLREK